MVTHLRYNCEYSFAHPDVMTTDADIFSVWLLPVWHQAIAGRLLAETMPQPARQQKKMAPKAHPARFTHQGVAGPIYSLSGRQPFATIWWPPEEHLPRAGGPLTHQGLAAPSHITEKESSSSARGTFTAHQVPCDSSILYSRGLSC